MANKVTITALRNAIKSIPDNDYTEVEWHDLKIRVFRRLSLDDYRRFVRQVSDTCFTDEGAYVPENWDPSVRLAVIELYTNLTLSSNIEENFDIAYQPGLFEEIIKGVDAGQYSELVMAANMAVEDRRAINAHMIEAKVDEAYAIVADIQQQLEEIFSGIGAGDMGKMINALVDEKFDEDKLARALIDAKYPAEPEVVETEVVENNDGNE